MYQLIIIGAGPAGLTAGLFAKQYGINFLLIGRISDSAVNQAHLVENYPGVKPMSGPKFIKEFQKSLTTKIKGEQVEKISRKKARSVMASGGLEPVVDEGGKGAHSVFASALIEALNENQGVLDATLLFSQIRRPVMVNADQTPEYSDIRKAGHDGGDFLFVKQKMNKAK